MVVRPPNRLKDLMVAVNRYLYSQHMASPDAEQEVAFRCAELKARNSLAALHDRIIDETAVLDHR